MRVLLLTLICSSLLFIVFFTFISFFNYIPSLALDITSSVFSFFYGPCCPLPVGEVTATDLSSVSVSVAPNEPSSIYEKPNSKWLLYLGFSVLLLFFFGLVEEILD